VGWGVKRREDEEGNTYPAVARDAQTQQTHTQHLCETCASCLSLRVLVPSHVNKHASSQLRKLFMYAFSILHALPKYKLQRFNSWLSRRRLPFSSSDLKIFLSFLVLAFIKFPNHHNAVSTTRIICKQLSSWISCCNSAERTCMFFSLVEEISFGIR
jgi:hypothetical protein